MKIEISINSWKYKYLKLKKTVTLPFKVISKLLFRLEDSSFFFKLAQKWKYKTN